MINQPRVQIEDLEEAANALWALNRTDDTDPIVTGRLERAILFIERELDRRYKQARPAPEVGTDTVGDSAPAGPITAAEATNSGDPS